MRTGFVTYQGRGCFNGRKPSLLRESTNWDVSVTASGETPYMDVSTARNVLSAGIGECVGGWGSV